VTALVVDELRPQDAARAAELDAVLFADSQPWSERAFLDALASWHHYLAAREGDELVGYAGLAFTAGPPRPEAEIHTVAVAPERQGRGIGRALVRGLLAIADAERAEVFLEVRTDNEPAHRLYESEGFTVVGLRRRYYPVSRADAHTMRREAVK
jgi:[ribosomal protein S18]-alanine N-acetyltransferase